MRRVVAARVRRISAFLIVLPGLLAFAAGATPTSLPAQETQAAGEPSQEELARSTAVALNYCRASFHRIRRYPSKRVMWEEQEKILNNLNLNQIADEDVVRLYTAVLQEIASVEIAERERAMIQERHFRVLRKQLVVNAFTLGTQLATFDHAGAIRTGASSWWDYRSAVWNREVDQWKVEKDRMQSVVDKSSQFLDTFWKLARKRSIPDRWLLRNNDLDRLEQVVQEEKLAVRLRVLERMENFMECYPPYWYYVARTQQQMGRFAEAERTFARLANVGDGHFRKDEMLAAGAANRALIQAHLKHPDAAKTARNALEYATDAWEVNLICANVLDAAGDAETAEDAVLRNLDMRLEEEESLNSLIAVYVHHRNLERLLARLSDPQTTRLVRMPLLVHAAALIGTKELPDAVAARFGSTLQLYPDMKFGADDLILQATPGWQLEHARISMTVGGRTLVKPDVTVSRESAYVSFPRAVELGHPIALATNAPPVDLVIEYPGSAEIRLQLTPGRPEAGTQRERIALFGFGGGQEEPALQVRPGAARIATIDVAQTRLSLLGPEQGSSPQPQLLGIDEGASGPRPALTDQPTPAETPAGAEPFTRPVSRSRRQTRQVPPQPTFAPATGEAPLPVVRPY